jgi:hypothetical protein
VAIGVRQVDLRDYEVVNAYARQPDGSVTVRQRTLIYLEPRDDL